MSAEVKAIWQKKKLEKYIALLNEVLDEADKEKEKPDTVWRFLINPETNFYEPLIDEVIIPEIKELLEYAKKGYAYFKYGAKKSQRMLLSFRLILEDPVALTGPLADKIFKLQHMFETL